METITTLASPSSRFFSDTSGTSYRSFRLRPVESVEKQSPWSWEEAKADHHGVDVSLEVRGLEFFDFLYGEATGGRTTLVRIADAPNPTMSDRQEPQEDSGQTFAQEMLASIRSDLSLNVSELAQVLRVQRPTVYAWMSGGKLRRQHTERLLDVHELAREWRARHNLPLGDSVREPGLQGKTIVDLLSLRNIPRLEITERFDRILQEDRQTEVSKHRPLSVREMRRLHGISSEGRSGGSEEIRARKRGESE